jgi:hypothetical protein
MPTAPPRIRRVLLAMPRRGGIVRVMHADAAPIICKPTRWFVLRALAILLMFSVFSVLFYIDGSTGYRKKNVVFYLHETFKRSNDEFARMDAAGGLNPDAWRAHAAMQTVVFPEDRSLVPADLELPMPWPEILHDYDRMKPLQWNRLWLEYTKEQGMDATPPEQPYDARKIAEQWIVFWICLALSAGALFFLLRTLGRSIAADDTGVVGPGGTRVPYGDFKTLDLRKWETKGLAFLHYDGSSGKGRLRIDGLTYGGFKAEQGEPAERLMQRIRSRFSGEILEYAATSTPTEPESVG